MTPDEQPAQPPLQRDAALRQARQDYRTEHGRWPSRSWKLMPPDAPKADTTKAAPPVAPLQSPERAAWQAAYANPHNETGPIGGSWPEDGRHVPYMRWKLPYSSGSQRPTPPRN
jgi:hypothetical protein